MFTLPETDTNVKNHPSEEPPIYSVAQISMALKRSVETQYSAVRVKGEISGAKLHSSGHLYFCLKDTDAVLDAICWRGSLGKLSMRPADGMEVVCVGRITTYPTRSKYQIIVESMTHAGVGALLKLLQERKQKLAAEGLFDGARKKALPNFPKTIGVITSPTGAVIRDILHRLNDRFPCRVLLWPVSVQGETAADEVTQAIKGFNALTCSLRPDVLIIARGGGSLEDLWAFNEENIVRATAESIIPVISAVGHETDTTLIDYVADCRAPTPTAAAEMAVPVLWDMLEGLRSQEHRISIAVRKLLQTLELQLKSHARGLISPKTILDTKMQGLDDRLERLRLAIQNMKGEKKQRLDFLVHRLWQASSLSLLNTLRMRFDRAADLLESYSYTQTLKRGFTLVKHEKNVISSAKVMHTIKEATLCFHDGEVKVAVSEKMDCHVGRGPSSQ